MKTIMKNIFWLLITTAAILGVNACGGGSAPNTHFNGDPVDTLGVQGTITSPSTPGDRPVSQPIYGSSPGAPLGTNPAYGETKPLEDLIKTEFISGTSSLKSSSQEDRVFWIAAVARGEEPIEGSAPPSFSEGDKIDLYMRYQVYETGLTISRSWYMEAAGLNFIEPAVEHPQAGIYQATFEFVIPYGSANSETVFKAALGSPHSTSIFVIPDQGDFREVSFEIDAAELLAPVHYPDNPDEFNDSDDGGCLPEITVAFNGAAIFAESNKELSNVVLEFADGVHEKWDDLDQDPTRVLTGEFWGTGDNAGKQIVRAWVKSGCNASGDGPGYGELFEPAYQELAMAQMCWEDLLANSDLDYNDFVGRIRATELRNTNNALVQIQLTVKAVARGAGYSADWQFNVNSAFPGVDVWAIVDQYYADGTLHGNQRIWASSGNGMAIPIFTPTRDALPPVGGWSTNSIPGTAFVDGDYAEVTILLDAPMAQGTYTPIPYEPELRVYANEGSVYTIPLWRSPADNGTENMLDSQGRPLAFIVPDTYAWPNESVPIWEAYPAFVDWVEWINNSDSLPEPTPPWYDYAPVELKAFDRNRFF